MINSVYFIKNISKILSLSGHIYATYQSMSWWQPQQLVQVSMSQGKKSYKGSPLKQKYKERWLAVLISSAAYWPEMQVWGFWWWDSLWLTDGADTHSEWAGDWWSLPPSGCWLPWQRWWCRGKRQSGGVPSDCAQSTGDKTMHFVHEGLTFHWSRFEVWMVLWR